MHGTLFFQMPCVSSFPSLERFLFRAVQQQVIFLLLLVALRDDEPDGRQQAAADKETGAARQRQLAVVHLGVGVVVVVVQSIRRSVECRDNTKTR
jgi:hypothetical protein